MEVIDEKKFKIKTNKNKEIELILRNYNNEELSIAIFNNSETEFKKYELKCNLEEFQKNRFFKIFINIEEIMKELENKFENSIFIEDTNCIIIEIKIGLTIINEILLVIEEEEINKDEIIEELKKKIELLHNKLNDSEKKLIDVENKIKLNEEKDKTEELDKKIKILENQIQEKDIKLKEAENKLNYFYGQQNYQQQQSFFSQPQQFFSNSFNPQSQPINSPSNYQRQYSMPQPAIMNQNIIPIHEHQISKKISNNKIKCSVCAIESKNEVVFSCNECGFDICQNCYNKIFNTFPKNIHPHQLLLINNKNDWTCVICKNKDRKSDISMNCKICNYNCCMNCYSNNFIPFNNNNQ